MARKKPMVYLTNSKKHFCSLCKCDMVLQEKEFDMKQIGGNTTISVIETILFCPSCKRFFITQEMSRAFVAKHHGYYVDVSLYDLRSSKKAKTSKSTAHNVIQDSSPANRTNTSANIQSKEKQNNEDPQDRKASRHLASNMGLNAELYLSNTYSTANNICPICRSVLSQERVIIPASERNGDFVQNYTELVPFCYKCYKAFVTKDIILSVLTKVNDTSKNSITIKIENATIHRTGNNYGYLFAPTQKNSYDIFFPGPNQDKNSEYTPGEMVLNAQSFLGKMGYSTNEAETRRHMILARCVDKYGKSKVLYQLKFNLDMRLKQKDGAIRYRHAINAWRGDIWYVENKL